MDMLRTCTLTKHYNDAEHGLNDLSCAKSCEGFTYAPASHCRPSSVLEYSFNQHAVPIFYEVITIRKCLVQLVSRHSIFVLGTKSWSPILKGCAIWNCVCHVLVIHRAHLTAQPSLCVVCQGAMATSSGCVVS